MYTYYRFLDKFHIEPKSWRDLFDYFKYETVESKIKNFVSKLSEGNK